MFVVKTEVVVVEVVIEVVLVVVAESVISAFLKPVFARREIFGKPAHYCRSMCEKGPEERETEEREMRRVSAVFVGMRIVRVRTDRDEQE